MAVLSVLLSSERNMQDDLGLYLRVFLQKKYPQTEDKLVLYTLESNIIKKNSASRKIGKQSYFFIRYLNFIVFSRALKKNFDCPTLVGRRSFFFKNNFVSLGLSGLQTKSPNRKEGFTPSFFLYISNETVTLLTIPTVDSKKRWELCAFAILSHKASPKPVPPSSRERDLSVR